MRIFSWIAVVLLLISCESDTGQKDYVTLKGKLNYENIDSFQIVSREYQKTIEVDENGLFEDTLKVETGYYGLVNGQIDGMNIFLKNGYDLEITMRGERFMEGAIFTGEGSDTNNYIDEKRAFFMGEEGNPEVFFALEKEAFDAKLESTRSAFEAMKAGKQLDSVMLDMDSKNDEMFFKYLESNYEKMHEMSTKFAAGAPSPKFVNYENFNGGSNSLDDFKGKFVYLDIWATWCAPCKAEIPYLKSLEKEFHDRNIEFISISVDKPQAYDTWRKMVEEEALSGVQLFADNNFESEFIQAYGINAIPRFILIDPEGNIVNADAKRPSDPTIKTYFEDLGI